MVARRSRTAPEVPLPPPPTPDRGDVKKQRVEAEKETGERVIHAIRRFSRSPAHARLTRTLYRVGGAELTPTQVDALEVLASRGQWHMHEFAAALDVNPSAASRTTDRLIKTGLAERRTDDADRRYVLVTATSSGRRTSRRIQRERHALMREVTNGLTDEQQFVLADLLERVTDAMELATRDLPHQDPAGA